MLKRLRSFSPFADKNSKILILGSMPGPEALRKQQYYGFEGNHFWTIIPALFDLERPPVYLDRLSLIRKNGIALWDVLESCERKSALDSDIKKIIPNKIPELLKRYPNIKAIFINGKYAHKTFLKHFGPEIALPVHYLPSTSPAHATLSLKGKIEAWSVIHQFLSPRKTKKSGSNFDIVRTPNK